MNTTIAPCVDDTAPAELLKRGERLLEPDVYRTCLNGQPAVIKDYTRYRGTPLSPLARLLVRREARILQLLSGWKHAPALLGTLGGLALGMEFIPGQTLSSATSVGVEVFEQLQYALGRLHAAGITHNDLHGTNVMVSGGVPVLVDFTSAWRSPRWLPLHPVSRQLRRSDMKNLLKMRQRKTGLEPTPAQAALVADPRWVAGLRVGWKRFYRWFKGHA
ncbi:RIO1 family regulatory kinase/ATPase [Stenotrophomonas rhizophila]|uniref:RIO1 family regulatory kinase/ATPase domain-containing protein n=1 Tax=Stenotrophomonas rhizophila TaxID=216778 RepID=UPI001E2B4DEA|nr:RIO1 family regulatory kinase/ATPase [Stenotrophomonas rhizophila]MCC7634383.1 kinase [Stenotrophomonas rhizophila]MCC7663781.1 kinase [Stenotrophomonas rhizophila]